MFRQNLKNFISYLYESNPSLTVEEICNLYQISIGHYYRWKEFFEHIDKKEIENF